MTKITKEEKELLILAIKRKIETDKQYMIETFGLVFDEPVKENIKEWKTLDDKKKMKIVKSISKFFDSAFISYANSVHGRFNVKKIMNEIKSLKDKQLKEFGVRKDD